MMRTLPITIFFSIVIALIDLLFFTLIGTGYGVLFIILSQITSGLIGWFILRKYDFNLLFFIDTEQKKRSKIVRELWEEFYLIIGGGLLLLPGILSDLIGILLLIKDFRNLFLDLFEP